VGGWKWRGHTGRPLEDEILTADEWIVAVGAWSVDGKVTTPTELWYPTIGLDMRTRDADE
jgi:hypothetical protein